MIHKHSERHHTTPHRAQRPTPNTFSISISIITLYSVRIRHHSRMWKMRHRDIYKVIYCSALLSQLFPVFILRSCFGGRKNYWINYCGICCIDYDDDDDGSSKPTTARYIYTNQLRWINWERKAQSASMSLKVSVLFTVSVVWFFWIEMLLEQQVYVYFASLVFNLKESDCVIYKLFSSFHFVINLFFNL